MPFNSALKSPDAQGLVVRVEKENSQVMSEPPEVRTLKALPIPAQLPFQPCFGQCRVTVKTTPGFTATAVAVFPTATDALKQNDIPAVPAHHWLLGPVTGCHVGMATFAGMMAISAIPPMAERNGQVAPQSLACPFPSSAPLSG